MNNKNKNNKKMTNLEIFQTIVAFAVLIGIIVAFLIYVESTKHRTHKRNEWDAEYSKERSKYYSTSTRKTTTTTTVINYKKHTYILDFEEVTDI